MSEPATPARPFYVTGGTLKPGEPSYVERRADTDLFESILAGEFCYVLTARQMGKSSLMARTAKRLEQAGVASAIVDLTQIGSERGAQGAAQWYFGIANKIHQQLRINVPLRPWWQERSDLSSVQRLTDFFRELVLTHCPGRVVIFVDEIDSTIGLPFADDFFAALRACFNARATEPEFERLTFVLLGVATPDQLIQDPTRTPFNIGKRIDLTDFSPAEARTLAPGLHTDPGEADRRLERILYWTGGHPYLSQALCRAVREKGTIETAENAIDPQVEELFLTSRAQREETNLKYARARLEKSGPEGRRLLQLYRRVCQRMPVPDQPTSPLFAQLKLAGVVKATDEGRLIVRNRVYESVFTPEWAKSAMPADRGRQLAVATLAASLAGVLIWYAVFQPRPYEEAFRGGIQADAYNVAFDAYTHLRTNPFSRSRATELMQQFWAHRALQYALAGQRDESLLSYLQGLSLKDSERLRKKARNLVGSDYERLRLTLQPTKEVRVMALSQDGQTFMMGMPGSGALLSVFRSGKLVATIFGQAGVEAVTLSPDGRIFAMRSGNTVRLWDAATSRPLTVVHHESAVHAVSFSSDGRSLATGSEDGTARLWDAFTGKPGPFLKHRNAVYAVAFSPDGRILATGSRDGLARLWDAVTGKLLVSLPENKGSIHAVAFSPNGRTLAVGTGDGTVRLWDTLTCMPLKAFLKHESTIYSVAFSSDGRTLATGSGDHTSRLWNSITGEPSSPPLLHESSVEFVSFSSDGRTLTTRSRAGTIRIWDSGLVKSFSQPSLDLGAVYAVALSPNGRTLATASLDITARLWDATTGRPLATPLQHNLPVLAATFSPDGRTLATGSEDGFARLWDVETGAPLATSSSMQHAVPIVSLAFSPDGRTLAMGSVDGFARLWDVRTNRRFVAFTGYQDAVQAVAFSPDGQMFAMGYQNGTVYFWNLATARLLVGPMPIRNGAQALAFNPNGKVFFVATNHWLDTYSWDGKIVAPQSSQLLHGFWKKAFRFPSDCENCVQTALGDTGDSFHLETLHFDEPVDPPIEGDPRKLLEKWQGRLGLKFDEQMRLVPAVDLPGEPAGADGGGRRLPGLDGDKGRRGGRQPG